MNTTNPAPPCPFVTPAQRRATAEQVAGAVRFSDLATEKIRWLWPDRIPLGRLTLLVSDPGLGKSLLSLDIAARVSRGAPWPDEVGPPSRGGPDLLDAASTSILPKTDETADGKSAARLAAPTGSVLLLTAEDDFADTVRPRLEALGADCDRILGISTWASLSETGISESRRDSSTCEVPRGFSLKRDLARLRNLLEAMPDCRLVVIDPINAYLGSTNTDVQSLLYSLTTIARERNVAILIVSQLRKKDGAAVYRALGSVSFVAAARASWAICQDPDDKNKRLFLPVKNNLAPHVAGLSYTIEPGPDPRAPTIRWSPEPVTDSIDFAIAAARAAGRPDAERQHAMKWLKERLAKSPIRASDAREEGDVQGINYATLRRAYREIGGKTVRKGRYPLHYWYWTLPGVTAQNPSGEFCAAGDDFDELADFFEPWVRRAKKMSRPTTQPNKPNNPSPQPLTPDTQHPTPDTFATPP